MRQTSIDTYNQIKREGLLSRLRFMVYDVIFHNGPITQGECYESLRKIGLINQRHDVGPRFAELKNLGVIIETEVRPCKLTGRKCIAWDVTDNLPKEFKRKTKDQIIKELKLEILALKVAINKYPSFFPNQRLLFNE